MTGPRDSGPIDLGAIEPATADMDLAQRARALPVGALVPIVVPPGPGWWLDAVLVDDLLLGAGFAPGATMARRAATERRRTLPDTVGPGMDLLVVGLNPSLRAADAGIGYVTPSNRFWPAAVAAGLVSTDRDPVAALHDHAMGMTDLVKRATRRADELTDEEYRTGLGRLERLCARLRPRAVCVVGLAGWRAAVDRRAVPGPRAERLGGSPVYVMPSTSGLNARTSTAALVEHLAGAARLASRPVAG